MMLTGGSTTAAVAVIGGRLLRLGGHTGQPEENGHASQRARDAAGVAPWHLVIDLIPHRLFVDRHCRPIVRAVDGKHSRNRRENFPIFAQPPYSDNIRA